MYNLNPVTSLSKEYFVEVPLISYCKVLLRFAYDIILICSSNFVYSSILIHYYLNRIIILILYDTFELYYNFEMGRYEIFKLFLASFNKIS